MKCHHSIDDSHISQTPRLINPSQGENLPSSTGWFDFPQSLCPTRYHIQLSTPPSRPRSPPAPRQHPAPSPAPTPPPSPTPLVVQHRGRDPDRGRGLAHSCRPVSELRVQSPRRTPPPRRRRGPRQVPSPPARRTPRSTRGGPRADPRRSPRPVPCRSPSPNEFYVFSRPRRESRVATRAR